MAQPPVAHPLTYLHDIPSLHESHQGVPAMLGTLDLDRGILAEDAINPNHLAHAKKVAKALKVIHGEFKQTFFDPFKNQFHFIQRYQ